MSTTLRLSLSDVVNGAVGPFGPYCMGYMNPGASGNGYICTMKLSVDKVNVAGLDVGTEGIISYDRCEKDDAYIGQINMGTASSFCGLNGALWGYHLAKADIIASGTLKPMFTYPGPLQGPVPVYAVGPLLDAGLRLFGRMDIQGSRQVDNRRFPPMPGAHVICANKAASQLGPAYIWSAIAIAIADDRSRDANLFIEDTGAITADQWTDAAGTAVITPTPQQVEQKLHQSLLAVAKSVILCGQDQNVLFKEIFAGVKYIYAGPDEWGCSLTCAPYVTLARDAVPIEKEAASLLDMSISQWEESLRLPPLPPVTLLPPGAGGIGVAM
jgi:histidine decarboxylase